MVISEMSDNVNSIFSGTESGNFFEVLERNGQNMKVKCKLCLPAMKILSVSVTSTSNLKKHVEVRNKRGFVFEELHAYVHCVY